MSAFGRRTPRSLWWMACGGQAFLCFKEDEVAMAAALVGFKAEHRHPFAPAGFGEAVECFVGLRLVQDFSVPGSGFVQFGGGPVDLGVAEFAAVFVDDPSIGQGAGEGGLAESRFARDRPHRRGGCP